MNEFQEQFALSPDRPECLKQLAVGTEEHDTYRCLLLQQQGRLDDVDRILKDWIDRDGRTGRARMIEKRQFLMRLNGKDPAAAKRLGEELYVELNHQPEAEEATASLPTRLQPEWVNEEAFLDQALNRHSDLSAVEDRALERLLDRDLPMEQLRDLLRRLTRPDHPRLVERVVEELEDRHSGDFGSLPIHHKLLPGQLAELKKLQPALAKHEAFVRAELRGLLPAEDVDLEDDDAERRTYLERVQAYVDELGSAFNGMKLCVGHHRLELDYRTGKLDRARLEAYLHLPRDARYMRHSFIEQRELRHHLANPQQDYRPDLALAPVGDDQDLVDKCLSHFLVPAADTAEFNETIEEHHLIKLMAEGKLLAGREDAQRWVTKLKDPAFIQQISERIELDFAPDMPRFFKSSEAVSLEMDVKNVETLLVKVFEVHSLNYFLAKGAEPDTAMDLDGLLPTEEQVHRYDEPPQRRVRRRFEFPSLDRPGVFVIEFIGNGRSSRALIRKGQLRMLERPGAAGHVIAVLDEDGQLLPEASLWMEAREHKAGEDGFIRLPFAERDIPRSVMLQHGALCQVARFSHLKERYRLTAGFYLDRESLLMGQEAQLLIRPLLHVADVPAPLELLEDVRLTISSTDAQGNKTQQESKGLKLAADAEFIHRFRVPGKLRLLHVALRAKVRNITAGKDEDLSAETDFRLNAVDDTDRVEQLHLAPSSEGWRLELLGKTGESRPGQPVNLRLVHRATRLEMHFALKTDEDSQVHLGPLDGMSHIVAATPSGLELRWDLPADEIGLPQRMQVQAGQELRLPCPRRPSGPPAAAFSLLRILGDRPIEDMAGHLKPSDGLLSIQSLPAGSYRLLYKDAERQVLLRVVDGPLRHGWILGERVFVEASPSTSLAITSIEESDAGWQVQLAGWNARTRLHAFGTRYRPELDLASRLGVVPASGSRSMALQKRPARYLCNRDIGDEMRYVLDRRGQPKRIGCMLDRPSLLVNPWPLRSTEADLAEAAAGESYAPCCEPAPSMARPAPRAQPSIATLREGFCNLDFLSRPAGLVVNLKPDSQGRVSIPKDAFGGAQLLRLAVCDERQFVVRHHALAPCALEHRDLRLDEALDPEEHFCQRRQASALMAGETLRIDDITAARFELIDSQSKLHRLLGSLKDEARFTDFEFLGRWPDLDEEEKQELCSAHACHELHLFLQRKDPEFFQAQVAPGLAHKKHKTFMDRYLLNEDLSAYLEPWAFARLNVAERVLLASASPEARGDIQRHIEDLCALLPPDPEGEQRLLETALGASGLEGEDSFGLEQAREMARGLKGEMGAARKAKKRSAARMRSGAPMAPPPPPAAPGGIMMAKAMPMEEAEEIDAELSMDMEMPMAEAGLDGLAAFGDRADLAHREEMKPMFRQQDKTREWAESHYYRLPLAQQGPELIDVNPFWRDLARHIGRADDEPFVSPQLLWAHGNFAEMVFAMALSDLPFRAGAHQVRYEELSMEIEAAGPILAFSEQIRTAETGEESALILINQSLYRADDRTRYEDGEQVEKPVTGPLLKHVVYVCQVVLTNPGSARQKLELLLQIPKGAMPLNGGFVTRGTTLRLDAHETRAIEYSFCFPMAGRFNHYPAQVTRNGQLVATAQAAELEVLDRALAQDTDSWPWLSQHGSASEVLQFLEQANLERIDLERMAWRMRDGDFFNKALRLLTRRKVFAAALWAYGLYHNDAAQSRQWLLHQADAILEPEHLYLSTPCMEFDGEQMGRYEHLDYYPLINARAHPLGEKRKILNKRFAAQYEKFMALLCQKARPSASDRLAVASYLLLQDRIAEARQIFGQIRAEELSSRMQHDYLALVLAFHDGDAPAARALADRHLAHPVLHWQKRFAAAAAQLDELEGAAGRQLDEDHRDQRQAKLADEEPGFEFKIEAGAIHLTHRNISDCRIHYFGVDIEILFSRQPFVQDSASRCAFIRPALSDEHRFPQADGEQVIPLPEQYLRHNVVVEIEAGGRRASQTHYANNLILHLTEPYGQLRVLRRDEGKALAGCYVKAFARMRDGSVRFYKDGYTDLRGKYDYASLNTDDLDRVERFALLVLDEEHGALVREATPPTR